MSFEGPHLRTDDDPLGIGPICSGCKEDWPCPYVQGRASALAAAREAVKTLPHQGCLDGWYACPLSEGYIHHGDSDDDRGCSCGLSSVLEVLSAIPEPASSGLDVERLERALRVDAHFIRLEDYEEFFPAYAAAVAGEYARLKHEVQPDGTVLWYDIEGNIVGGPA